MPHIVASLLTPEGLAFDASGNLYVTDFNESIIYEYGRNGKQRIIASGPRDHITNPSALAFDSSGNLFVAHNGTNPGIAKIAPDGTITSFVQPLEPTGLAFDSAGNLLVSDLVDGTIYKITPDGTKSSFATGLLQPLGLAFDPDGNLFVADYENIFDFAPDGARSTFARGKKMRPWDLAFRP